MKTLRLSDVVGAEARIDGATYEDTEIHGPIVLQLSDSNNNVEECVVDRDLDQVMVGIDKEIRGTIAISSVTFRRCIFRNVGFVGPETLIDRLKSGAQFRP